MRIDIGIACSKHQDHHWWLPICGLLLRAQQAGIEIGQLLAIGTAMPDETRNLIINNFFIKPSLTSENRNEIVSGFESGDAEGIMWIDDDTIPPPGTIERLIALDSDISAGLYVRRSLPHDPLAFFRLPDGRYRPIFDFRYGEIKEIDSVGMGCTFVWRRVYDQIRARHVLFKRADTNSLMAIAAEKVLNVSEVPAMLPQAADRVLVSNEGVYRIQVLNPLTEPPGRWPFYVMEHLRTEDHFFCEMAKTCGLTIKVDTGIECDHWGGRPITPDDFRTIRAQYLREVGDARS